VFGALPWRLSGQAPIATAGLGITYVGPRALPYRPAFDAIFTIDGSASVAGIGRRSSASSVQTCSTPWYRLGEYNYASDFHSQSEPTLTIARQFTTGAPRTVLFQVEVTL